MGSWRWTVGNGRDGIQNYEYNSYSLDFMIMNISGWGVFVLLIINVRGNWEEVGERILNKIKKGLTHTFMNVKTCGLPRITKAPKNLTLGSGDEARFCCNVDMTCIVS